MVSKLCSAKRRRIEMDFGEVISPILPPEKRRRLELNSPKLLTPSHVRLAGRSRSAPQREQSTPARLLRNPSSFVIETPKTNARKSAPLRRHRSQIFTSTPKTIWKKEGDKVCSKLPRLLSPKFEEKKENDEEYDSFYDSEIDEAVMKFTASQK